MYQTFLETVARRKGTLLAIAIVAVCVWAGIRLPQSLEDLQNKRREIRELNERNASARLENERRRERIQRLETNPSEQEMEIRKQLKLARPGETTFILPVQPASDTSNNKDAPAAPESKR
jgi:cell division protein FtsB